MTTPIISQSDIEAANQEIAANFLDAQTFIAEIARYTEKAESQEVKNKIEKC